jgi:hypothetical protein
MSNLRSRVEEISAEVLRRGLSDSKRGLSTSEATTQILNLLYSQLEGAAETLSEIESTTPNTYNFKPIQAVPLERIKELLKGVDDERLG